MKDQGLDLDQRSELIRTSWSQVSSNSDLVAHRFYSILFSKHPDTKPLFKSDMQGQGQKLVETLSFIVDQLEDTDILLPAAHDLAKRHVAYSVMAEDYDAVGATLIETFETILGSQLTNDMKQAWLETYSALCTEMFAAAYPGTHTE